MSQKFEDFQKYSNVAVLFRGESCLESHYYHYYYCSIEKN